MSVTTECHDLYYLLSDS